MDKIYNPYYLLKINFVRYYECKKMPILVVSLKVLKLFSDEL